jgi:uncharacterized cupin superfamily protein
VTRVFNLLDGELTHTREQESWSLRSERVGDALGSERIGGTVYLLGDEARTFPYHFHYGVEEWLLVLEGTPTVRTPDGERTLSAGEVVCFPVGEPGAHDVRGPGRVLILSANRAPSISVYPDSDKIGTRPGDVRDNLNFRRADAVGYWEGET